MLDEDQKTGFWRLRLRGKKCLCERCCDLRQARRLYKAQATLFGRKGLSRGFLRQYRDEVTKAKAHACTGDEWRIEQQKRETQNTDYLKNRSTIRYKILWHLAPW